MGSGQSAVGRRKDTLRLIERHRPLATATARVKARNGRREESSERHMREQRHTREQRQRVSHIGQKYWQAKRREITRSRGGAEGREEERRGKRGGPKSNHKVDKWSAVAHSHSLGPTSTINTHLYCIFVLPSLTTSFSTFGHDFIKLLQEETLCTDCWPDSPAPPPQPRLQLAAPGRTRQLPARRRCNGAAW